MVKVAPAARRALQHDVAAALLHDPVDGGEPEAGALPRLLGGEEGLEDPGLVGRLDAHAGVAHLQRDVGAGPDAVRPGCRRVAGQLAVRGGDRDPAALRHRVARVHHQVHQHLLDLARIGQHVPEGGVVGEVEHDVGADQAAEHAVGLANDIVEREHLRLEHLAPAEGEQLPGEPRGALPRLPDLLDVASDRVALPHLLQQEVAVAEDGGEQVVEVVGDPAGELADGLHLLGLAELLLAPAERRFGGVLLAHVLVEDDRAFDGAAGAGDRAPRS